MKSILSYVAILPVSCALCYGTRANLPVYFIAGDPLASGCQVFSSPGSPQITSGGLEFRNGQRINFLGARSGVACTGEETENRLSVFTGQDPSKWRPHLPISRRIRFRSVYPGIDIVYYGNGSHLEYDFELAPQADASRIRLIFGKNAGLKISPAGDLLVSANGSILIQHRPRAHQGPREIPANYAIDQGGTRVRIDLGKYDRSKPVIIDPVLGWQASFDGGAGAVNAVAVDPAGNMWILSDFPGTVSGYTNTYGHGGGSRDVMVFKVDPTGSRLLSAVLLGGSGYEFANGLAIGNDGSTYIAGSTYSPDFPVTPKAFQTSLPSLNGGAAFVVKLSPQGDSLIYSTYLGGTGGARATAIGVDPDGNAFVAGTPVAPDFPVTTGSWQDHFSFYPLDTPYALRPITGGFVAKLNSTGTALLYSTLIDETPVALTLNSAGAAYVVGAVLPYLGPLKQYTLKVGDSPSVIVTRLTPDGSQADMTVALSCLNPLLNTAGLIALDSKKNILVGGSSVCATFPAGTGGAFQPQHTPLPTAFSNTTQYDGLIVKIASDASAVLAATFLGGSDVDQLQAINVASDDSIMVAGGTSSSDFPVTPDALNSKYGGGAIGSLLGDGFFARLSPNLDRLIYSTWLGGKGPDDLTAMALDLADNTYLGGFTLSGGLESPGVFTFNGAGSLWALKLARDAAAPPVIASVSPATLNAGSSDSSIQITGANFAHDAVVLVNGTPAPVVFTSSTQLTATVSAASLAADGLLELRVLNPGRAASDRFLLPVVATAGVNPKPRIESLLPNGLPVGSPAGNIIVTGSGFLSSTTAAVNANPRVTSLNPDGTLSVALTQADLSAVGTLSLTLTNPSPGGGLSDPAVFLVSSVLVPRQPPGLSSVAPSRPDNASDTPITIGVSGLTASMVARWNGTDHPIDFTHSTFVASAADLAHAGTAEVTVYDRATGLESNPLPVWIPFAPTVTDMAWNPANRRLYLSTSNSVIVLNPDTGDAEVTIPVDLSIARLAVSPDGGYLFATSSTFPSLRRYQILAAAPWLANPLDLSISGTIDFAPVPGSPGSVAVYSNSSFPSEIAIYDGSVKRPTTVRMSVTDSLTALRALQFSDDGRTLYYVAGYSEVIFISAPVTSSGLGAAVRKVSANLPTFDTSNPARYFQGRIYTLSGAVFDAATMARVGSVPVSSYTLPLVSPAAVIMLDTSNQYTCSLQAFDPVSFVPLWEENTRPGCDSNYYPYSDLFDAGGERFAFRMTKAYLVKKPASAPQFSLYPVNSGLQATLELGTTYVPDNEVAVLSPQTGLPAVAILLADQPDGLSLGAGYQQNRYQPFSAPGYFDFEPSNIPTSGTNYTGRVAILITNTTNPPVLVPYQLSFVNPYPLQASVSSLSFTWRIGDPVPPPQSFSLTKQGKTLPASAAFPLPAWLIYQNSGNGPPETITIGVNPAGLAPGTYTANVTIGYYCADLPVSVCGAGGGTSPGSVTVPVTLTVAGPGGGGGGQDLAQNQPASQSSTLPGTPPASVAVDGNTGGNFSDRSVTATNLDNNPWWQVDLGASAPISSIVVWNRTDCCGSRLSDYWVFVSNTAFQSTDTPSSLAGKVAFSSHQTTSPNPSTSIPVGITGRYVRVQLSGTDYLSLAEVQVFGMAGSAPVKVASQSSQLPGSAPASAAIDGNTDGNFFDGSVTATNLDPNAWWQVDLGSSTAISSIAVWNRTDCCGSRLSDYWVFVSDTPFLSTDTPSTLQNRLGAYASHQTVAPNPSTTIPSVTQGRYVRIQLSSPNYLSLAEVQVFSSGGSSPPVKVANQSSTLSGTPPAGAAIDGNTDGNFTDGSVTATNLDSNAWWQVDLGGATTINSVTAWNRTDCCASRLSDFWVFVSNTPFLATDTPATLQARAGTFANHQTSAPSPSVSIPFGGVQGRYVRVQLTGANFLSLAEVQVQ